MNDDNFSPLTWLNTVSGGGYLLLLLVFLCTGCLSWPATVRPVERVAIAENPTIPYHPAWQTFASGADIEWMTFDGEGNLWTAGRDGVRQWNLTGRTCVKHGPEHGVPGNFVVGLATSGDGSVWAATLSGVANFRQDHWIAYPLGELPMTEKLWGVAGGPGNTAWVSGGGAAYFDGIRWESHTDVTWIESLAVSNTGVAWGTLEGLSRFDGEQWLSVSDETRIKQIEIAPDGTVWGLLFEGGLLRYTDVTGPEIIPFETYSRAPVTIAVGPDNKLWLVVADRIAIWDGLTWEYAFAEDGISAITVAEDGALWYALRRESGSVYRFTSGKSVEYALTGYTPMFNTVADLAVGNDGTVWVVDAHNEKNVFRYDPGVEKSGWESVRFGSRGLTVHAVTTAPNGRVWFGTSRGLWFFDGERSFTRLSEMPCIAVQAWSVTSDGRMWVACGIRGIYTESLIHFDGTEWRVVRMDELQEVTALAAVGPNEVWLGTETGRVKRWDGVDWQRVELPSELVGKRKPILAMAVVADQIWFSMSGAGLIRYNATDITHWERLTTADGLPSDYVISLVPDPDGGLWIGTSDRGAAHFKENTWQTYTTADGLTNDRVNLIDVSSTGDVWFGTYYGISHCACQDLN